VNNSNQSIVWHYDSTKRKTTGMRNIVLRGEHQFAVLVGFQLKVPWKDKSGFDYYGYVNSTEDGVAVVDLYGSPRLRIPVLRQHRPKTKRDNGHVNRRRPKPQTRRHVPATVVPTPRLLRLRATSQLTRPPRSTSEASLFKSNKCQGQLRPTTNKKTPRYRHSGVSF